jgi:hypothetical protein
MLRKCLRLIAGVSDSDLQDLALIPRKDLLRDADQPEILSRVQESPRAVLADGQTDPGSFDVVSKPPDFSDRGGAEPRRSDSGSDGEELARKTG